MTMAKLTYHSVAQGELDDLIGGRFGASGRKTKVVGAGPVAYPAQPVGSPWAKNELPDEPLIDGRGEGIVLGYEIDRPDAVTPIQPVGAVGEVGVRPGKFVRRA